MRRYQRPPYGGPPDWRTATWPMRGVALATLCLLLEVAIFAAVALVLLIDYAIRALGGSGL